MDLSRRAAYLLLLLAVLAIGHTASAQGFPRPESTTVNDFAGLLLPSEEVSLHDQLVQLETETGIEMTIVTLSRKDMFAPGTSLERFARDLFDAWGIGKADSDNGILVLILHRDREMRIELGAGYGRAWDRAAQRVIDRSFLPAFREEDYARGITTGVPDVIRTIALPYAEGAEPPAARGGLSLWWVAGIGVAFVALFVAARRMVRAMRKCPECGQRGQFTTRRNTLKPATRSTRGEAEEIAACGHCNFSRRTLVALPIVTAGSDSGSGSGGSFGGGSSGGGGASGSW